uniref:Uncharacterized protein n=1 Tax=Ananas comosus var. bracteatus TaxID=296719 RepID=A0A6V7PZC6_ANACO|nr:unnamed protein product [Ananas comosus var. bracteatus]
MVGKELAIRKVGPVDLREVAAKTTLRDVRLKGHTYVELRHAGKRIIFSAPFALLHATATPCCLIILRKSSCSKEVVSNLRVRFLGIGNVAYKINENIEAKDKVTKIWCAWSGQEASDGSEEMKDSHQCDFAIVNFVYTYDLGRKKKSFSDHENSSEHNSSSNSPSENGSGPDGCSADSSSHLQIARLSSKSARKELRKQKRLCSERACDICGQPILPGKDVATLLNCKTGNLACSSRNTNGAFHLFHASCLVHWILLCEYELLVDQSYSIKSGTGIHIEGQELEKPTVSLSEMFLYKLKALEAHKAWMKNPEVLQKCSTGLYFPHESEENAQEKVMPLNLLHFYRADE